MQLDDCRSGIFLKILRIVFIFMQPKTHDLHRYGTQSPLVPPLPATLFYFA